MPLIEYQCALGHGAEVFYHNKKDITRTIECALCGGEAKRCLISRFSIYGTDKYHDRGFKDASLAFGKRVTSNKEVDRLCKETGIVPVTCPSQYHHPKRKK